MIPQGKSVHSVKSSNDDETCSLICYKNDQESPVRVLRIRQMVKCSVCQITRSTLSLYAKHLQENAHREKVKKSIEINAFSPSIYDRAIHLGLLKNFHYQSEKFHFRYKSIDATHSFEVTLIFDEKSYRRTGPVIPKLREELLEEMLKDRLDDLVHLTPEVFHSKKQSLTFVRPANESIASDQSDDVEQLIETLLTRVLSKTKEFQDEKAFLSGIARRNFRKKSSFHCDVCSIFLSSEKICEQHLNSREHREKMWHYQEKFPPWRRAMQESLITGRSLEEIIGKEEYHNYKQTMGEYLAPSTLSNRGRFACGFCEQIFSDQWSLEKHLHLPTHREKINETSNRMEHRGLLVRFANSIVLPSVFKFNGVDDVAQVPEEIRERYQWRQITREQLDQERETFLRSYPFDRFEGVTQLISQKTTRRQKKTSRPFHKTSIIHQPLVRTKRPHPYPQPVNKRFRPDFDPSYSIAQRTYSATHPRIDMPQYPSNESVRYPNPWSRTISDDAFERANFELRSIASNQHYPPMPYNPTMRPFHPPPPPPAYPRSVDFYPPPLLPPPPPSFGPFAPNTNHPRARLNGYAPVNGFTNHFSPSGPPSMYPPMHKSIDESYFYYNRNFRP